MSSRKRSIIYLMIVLVLPLVVVSCVPVPASTSSGGSSERVNPL